MSPPTSQLLQSPLLCNSLLFTNTKTRRNHNKIQRVNQIGFASKQEDGQESNNPRSSLQAQQMFLDTIKALPFKERTQIFNRIEKHSSSSRDWSISEFNKLLMALFFTNEHDIALKLYSDISSYGLAPDSWTFSIIIRCHCKKNKPIEARHVLDSMVDNGLYPNVSTFTILINSLCRSGRLQKAFEVFEIMGRIGCKPSIRLYNCLLKGLCYVGRVEEAFEMLTNMKNDSMLEPDIYTYTAVMDGFCKVGRSNEAMELLNEAVEKGLNPSVVTYNTLFNGYCKEGRPMEGFAVLKLMKERNCLPDQISYFTMLNGLLKWREIGAAVEIYKEMVGFGFEVDERMMNTLLRGLCMKSWEDKEFFEDAYQVFDKMTSEVSGTDVGTYGMVIRTLCMGKKTDEALVHLHHMIRKGHIPRTITFNNMIQALCGEGKVVDALFVVFLMYEYGKIPSRTSFDLLIKKLNRLERSSGACIVYGAALKQGVVPQSKPQELGTSCKTMLI